MLTSQAETGGEERSEASLGREGGTNEALKRHALLALVLLTAALAGCAGSSPGVTERGPAEVQSDRDVCLSSNEYFVQRGGAGALTITDPWENDCRHASGFVQMGGLGVVNVTVKDAEGKTVLNVDTSPVTGGKQDFKTSSEGTPGTWRIEVTGAYAGGVQFSLSSAAQP